MNDLSRGFSILSVLLLTAGFILLIRQMKKTSRMSSISHLLSMAFSFILLLFNVYVLRSAEINWWFVFLLIFGAGFGFAWGTTTRLKLQDNHVIGKRSVLYIYFWLASLLVTQILAFFAKTSTVALGLGGMFFSTGASLGTNSNIIYRMRKLVCSLKFPIDSRLNLASPTTSRDISQIISRKENAVGETESLTRQKSIVPERKENNFFALKIIGGCFTLLLIAFVLIRFMFAEQIFPMQLKIGEKELTLNIPESTTKQVEVLETDPTDTISQTQSDVGETLLLFEDFNSMDQATIALYNIEYMRYFNSEGYGVIESAVHPGLLPIIFPQVKVTDFVVEFDFLMPESLNDSSCGLLFRANGLNKEDLSQYYALFLFPKTNVIKMGLLKDAQISFSPVIEPKPSFNLGLETNHVRVEVKGENMKIYLNGDFATSLSEGSLIDAGYIGLFLYPSESSLSGNGDYVLFDNLKIYPN
jgi:membrane protein CcdC involved in cytochrome C biogenesis